MATNIGLGHYNSHSPLQPQVISDLSKAGYYAIFEGGKLKTKQQYYADRRERLRKEERSYEGASPGPGQFQVCTLEKSKLHSGIGTHSMQTLMKVNKSRDSDDSSYLGPGYYNVNTDLIKPRVKVAPEWGKPSATPPPQQEDEDNDFEDKEVKELPSTFLSNRKPLPQFVSKVPRFLVDSYEANDKIDDPNNTPGPGYYIKDLNSLKPLKQAFSRLERFQDSPQYINQQNSIQIYEPVPVQDLKPTNAFCSKTKREFVVLSKNTPGPGKYECKNKLLPKKPQGKGNFPLGGIGARFLNPQLVAYISPGPGEYIADSHIKSISPSCIFLNKKTKPRKEQNDSMPVIGQYSVESYKSISEETKRINKGGGNGIFRFIKLKTSKKLGFSSLSPRFEKEKLDKVPGPCYYKVKNQETEKNIYINRINKTPELHLGNKICLGPINKKSRDIN